MQVIELSEVVTDGFCHALKRPGKLAQLVVRVHLYLSVECARPQAFSTECEMSEGLPHNPVQKD
jgi:hypothetical protein